MSKNILVLPGDGIGQEVTASAKEVLEFLIEESSETSNQSTFGKKNKITTGKIILAYGVGANPNAQRTSN